MSYEGVFSGMTEPSPDPGERLTALFHEVRSELVGLATFLVRSGVDPEEAVQETFIKCWRRRHELAEVRDLRGWVFTVAWNAARDLERRAGARRRAERGLAEALARGESGTMARTAVAGGGPVLELEQREQVERVRRQLHELPREEREVFLLRENAGMTYGQIAEVTGNPVGTVKSRMRAALRRLREALRERSDVQSESEVQG